MAWSSSYVAALPDKAFLFIDKKTGERKLPVFNKQGGISLSHLYNAKARLNQTKGLNAKKRAQIRKRIAQLEKKALQLPRNYKYMVVKSTKAVDGPRQRIVAYATTKSEATAEASRVGGKVRKNPAYRGK